jgi:hypothetical protein
MASLGLPHRALAQGSNLASTLDSATYGPNAEIPDAPVPNVEVAESSGTDPQQAAPVQQLPPPAAPASGTGQSSSSSQSSTQQNSTQQTDPEEIRRQKQEEEVREQEHQRLAGIVPSFNVTYHSDAVSLTPAEKFELEFRAAVDPYTFAIAFIVAGLGEAEDTNSGFGWGPEGYFKRSAAEYADNVIGNTLGNAVLPVILHQDPRYYRLGHGSVKHRMLYAFATTFICKHDNTGKWEPNYSNVLGNMIAGEISNAYYPNGDFGKVGLAVGNGLTVTFEGAFGSELQEFWPDISRKFFHKDPTHGLDAQARAADEAKKREKQQEKNNNSQP